MSLKFCKTSSLYNGLSNIGNRLIVCLRDGLNKIGRKFFLEVALFSRGTPAVGKALFFPASSETGVKI